MATTRLLQWGRAVMKRWINSSATFTTAVIKNLCKRSQKNYLLLFSIFSVNKEAWLQVRELSPAVSQWTGLASSVLPASAGRQRWRVHGLPQPSWAVRSTAGSWGHHRPVEWVRCSGRSPVCTSSGAALGPPVCLEELPEETKCAQTKSWESKASAQLHTLYNLLIHSGQEDTVQQDYARGVEAFKLAPQTFHSIFLTSEVNGTQIS